MTVFLGDRHFSIDAEAVELVNVVPADLAPLAAFKRLRELRILWTNPHETPIDSPLALHPLARLERLEVLVMPDLSISDLEPLRSLPLLRELDISGTRVEELSPLAGKQLLRVLRARSTRVHDLEPLRGMPSLAILDVAHTPVADLAPIADLDALRELYLEGSNVADLTPLLALAHLDALTVHETPVDSLAVLRELRWFQTAPRLDLSGTRITDLHGIEHASAVEELFLYNTGVTDLSPLAALRSLRVLRIENTPVTPEEIAWLHAANPGIEIVH